MFPSKSVWSHDATQNAGWMLADFGRSSGRRTGRRPGRRLPNSTNGHETLELIASHLGIGQSFTSSKMALSESKSIHDILNAWLEELSYQLEY